ncbi:hypothetical protein ABPG72_015444 [Tetrahymena utriculariae]
MSGKKIKQKEIKKNKMQQTVQIVKKSNVSYGDIYKNCKKKQKKWLLEFYISDGFEEYERLIEINFSFSFRYYNLIQIPYHEMPVAELVFQFNKKTGILSFKKEQGNILHFFLEDFFYLGLWRWIKNIEVQTNNKQLNEMVDNCMYVGTKKCLLSRIALEKHLGGGQFNFGVCRIEYLIADLLID